MREVNSRCLKNNPKIIQYSLHEDLRKLRARERCLWGYTSVRVDQLVVPTLHRLNPPKADGAILPILMV